MRILYIDIDSLRPDHLGCYGYHRNTSPAIDEIARQGVRFESVYASDVPCLPSRTAFFGGWCGTKTGVINHGGLCADLPPQGANREFRTRHAENSLASRLVQLGYWTSTISPFPRRHSAYQMMWGFSEFFDTGKGGLENGDEMFEPAADWLRRKGKADNWFLHLNMWDPHTPYDTPLSFGNPFADDPMPSWMNQDVIDLHRSSYGPHSAREVPGITDQFGPRTLWGVGSIKNASDAKAHFDGYDCGVRYSDLYVGRLMELLDALGVLEETAVIISADHGENLGELNVWGDHQTADEYTCHIPAVVRWPGVTDSRAGEALPGLSYHMDLAATIIDMAGGKSLERPYGDAHSLRGMIDGSSTGRSNLFLSQGAWSLQRSVRWKNWLLIQTVDTGQKDFPTVMLFDLKSDPHETTNLSTVHPAIVEQGLAEIVRAFSSFSESCPHADPFDVVLSEGGSYHANLNRPDWSSYVERLRNTERAHHADWLTVNGNKPRPDSESIFGSR